MDIVIKSFNRPYYLDRCIYSVLKYVSGDFKIHVLDDGTPQKYLKRILEKYPEVNIVKSDMYDKKSKYIESYNNNKNEFKFDIPTNFWINFIEGVSNVFLLIEDDIWLIDKIDVNEVRDIMDDRNMIMLKIAWLGNKSLIKGKSKKINSEFEFLIPNIPYTSQIVFLDRFKRLHARGILYRLGLMHDDERDYKFQIPFYTIYTVASAFFDKKYWLYLWENSGSKVNEGLQLKRAADWFLTKKPAYGKSIKELTKTSFITSATNMYDDVNLDIFNFNYHLNEAWLSGKLNSMNSFPNDFSIEYIGAILDEAADETATLLEWKKWVTNFKNQYRKSGCAVD